VRITPVTPNLTDAQQYTDKGKNYPLSPKPAADLCGLFDYPPKKIFSKTAKTY